MKDDKSDLAEEFSSLLCMHASIIRKMLFLYADDESDRADLEQEICLQLWKSYPHFKSLSKFETWMYRVSLNTALLHIKRKRSFFKLQSKVKANILIFDQTDDDEYEIPFALVKQCINQLKHIEKALLHFYLEKKTYTEIADIMGFSTKNINVRMCRIRKKLKNLIELKLREE